MCKKIKKNKNCISDAAKKGFLVINANSRPNLATSLIDIIRRAHQRHLGRCYMVLRYIAYPLFASSVIEATRVSFNTTTNRTVRDT